MFESVATTIAMHMIRDRVNSQNAKIIFRIGKNGILMIAGRSIAYIQDLTPALAAVTQIKLASQSRD